jgi:hypothetical protein
VPATGFEVLETGPLGEPAVVGDVRLLSRSYLIDVNTLIPCDNDGHCLPDGHATIVELSMFGSEMMQVELGPGFVAPGAGPRPPMPPVQTTHRGWGTTKAAVVARVCGTTDNNCCVLNACSVDVTTSEFQSDGLPMPKPCEAFV